MGVGVGVGVGLGLGDGLGDGDGLGEGEDMRGERCGLQSSGPEMRADRKASGCKSGPRGMGGRRGRKTRESSSGEVACRFIEPKITKEGTVAATKIFKKAPHLRRFEGGVPKKLHRGLTG